MTKLLRPYGVVVDGHLELGIELVVHDGVIQEIRPHTGIPEAFVISSAFVNAHSHLEYRAMMGKIEAADFPSWLRRISELKASETAEETKEACQIAFSENRKTGVGYIGEHSDRPGSAEAMAGTAGWIFQEVITISDLERIPEKLEFIRSKMTDDRTSLSPHAPYTVDDETLRLLGEQRVPLSIHVAETPAEKAMWERNEGPLVDLFARCGRSLPPLGRKYLDWLEEWGYLAQNRQFVHACDLDAEDFERMAKAGVGVAHCPRSNRTLRCPRAKVRQMLEAGLNVGLGLDSAASGGPIDMFAEMQEALQTSEEIGQPVVGEEVWRMATKMGLRSVLSRPPIDWEVQAGSSVPLIKIHYEGAHSVRDLIESGSPALVDWVD